jgi:dolichol kinase
VTTPDAASLARVRFEARRKVLHVVTAIVAVPVVLVVPYWLALVLAVAGLGVVTLTWGIERRRFPPELKGPLHEPLAHVLETTRRPGEDFPWSPVLYTLALVLVTTAHQFFGLSWAVAFAAYAILGIGDAASALVGVAYGKRKLPWNRRKSLEGTTAGAAAGFLAGAVLGAVPYVLAASLIPPLFVVVVLAGAVVGALAETLPRVEDNFVVPLASAAAMWLVAAALRVALP